eukprot:gene4977-34756_t
MASSSSSSLYSALDVRGMTVLITGASSGFGEAIAWRCAELGCKLVLIARRTERLTELSSAIVAKFPGTLTHAVTLDVRDLTAIAELSAKLPSEFAEASDRQRCSTSPSTMASSSSLSLFSTLDVRGTTVLITGASARFGEAIAWRCAELGCKLGYL